MIKDFTERAQLLRTRFSGVVIVGVSVGGPLDPERGIIYSPPHLPGWDALPLRDLVERDLRLRVIVEHDAVACLTAEWIWGAARNTTHAVYCTAGTGFGAGIMIDGKVVRGPSGQTTEIGHLRLAEKGPFLYGKNGSAESFCSGTGITLMARDMHPDLFAKIKDSRELCQCAELGSPEAREVLMESARWTGRAYAILADLFSPEVIIAGSLSRYLPPWWLNEVVAELRREALPNNCSHTRVVPPELGDQVQDLSAIGPCLFHTQNSL
jgi:glucokinase